MNELFCIANLLCSRPVIAPGPRCALHRTLPELEQRINCAEIYRRQDRNLKQKNQPNLCDTLRYSARKTEQEKTLWSSYNCVNKEDF